MVWMDMNLPKCCVGCDMEAVFPDGETACVLLPTENNIYGLELIPLELESKGRLENCPLNLIPKDIEPFLRGC